MDLKLSDHQPTDAEVEAVARVLGPAESGWHGGPRGLDAEDAHVARGGASLRALRHRLLPVLHAVNDRVGWISRGAINHIAVRLAVAPADIFGVAAFYGLFSTTERPPRQVHVCVDLACQRAGARVPDGAHASPCLGVCERAPAALLVEAGPTPSMRVVAPAKPLLVRAALAGGAPPEPPVVEAVPQCPDRTLPLLGRVGVADPEQLASYREHGGYRALPRALELGPAGVIRELEAARLLGRGGAGFPTGRKWAAVAAQPARPRYLVVNADESEPGTFKDRVLMEGDPFALVEAATIAAFATGCTHGYVYLRGEYPRARERLASALAQAEAAGLLGDDILGSGLSFRLELFVGAGAYICGEETAIFNSIEGYRGEPRNKPPFPVEQGLFDKPTLVNSVETLANVLPIVLHGGAAYAARGTQGSTGTRLFCLSGAVVRPGVYEVDCGVTLRALLERAGGLPPGRSLRAVLLGGAAGVFAAPEELDVPLSFEATRAAGLTLGSGVVMVLDDETDLQAFVLRIADFFRDESCGQCVPCRVGTVRQQEVLRRMAAGAPATDARQLLQDLGRVLRDASICGLGQTANSAVASAVQKLGVFP